MSITSTFMRSVLVASLLATGAVLGGCEGDDGLDGAQGPPGEPGEPGAPGPEGPPGVGTTKPLESCGVCHDQDSIADVSVAHAITDAAGVSDVVISESGNNLVVAFKVLFSGVVNPSVTAQRVYRQYVVGGEYERDTVYRFDRPADTTNEVVLAYNAATGEGLMTVIDGAADFGATQSTYLFQLGSSVSGTRGAAYFTGSYPDSAPVYAVAVDEESCEACHGTIGVGIHRGNPLNPSTCAVCHAGFDEASLVNVVHGIHGAHQTYTRSLFEGAYVRPSGHYEFDEDIFETTYPTYMANCSVCHEGFLDAVNEMPVTGEGCFTCHESMESWETLFTANNLTFHLGYDESTNCAVCHNDADNVAPATVAEFHNGIVTERAGIIWDGVDTSVEEGAKFTWTITGVVDDGTNLAIDWEATYDGAPVDPCNATVGEGAPVFHAVGGGSGGTLSILYTYMQGQDPILGTNLNQAGQAESVNLTTTNTTCEGTVATTTVPVTRPLVAGVTVGRIAIQGKPGVVSVVDPTTFMRVRAKSPTYDFMVGSGDAATARRTIVDTTEKCVKCHVGSLYQHGGNRVDNVDLCILCHNSASNEQYVREDIYNIDASVAYDGKAGQTFEMKSMLHAIHSAGEEGAAPIVIYRPAARGIYAWAPDESLLQNWPGEGPNEVFGSDSGLTPNHYFHKPTYPRRGNDCFACHAEADPPNSAGWTSLIPDQRIAMATTLEAVEAPWENQVDDVLQGASAAACTSCHSDGAAKGHAYQNGWTPQAFEDGRQTVIDATK